MGIETTNCPYAFKSAAQRRLHTRAVYVCSEVPHSHWPPQLTHKYGVTISHVHTSSYRECTHVLRHALHTHERIGKQITRTTNGRPDVERKWKKKKNKEPAGVHLHADAVRHSQPVDDATWSPYHQYYFIISNIYHRQMIIIIINWYEFIRIGNWNGEWNAVHWLRRIVELTKKRLEQIDDIMISSEWTNEYSYARISIYLSILHILCNNK